MQEIDFRRWAERRAFPRMALTQPVRYSVQRGNRIHDGFGRTTDISANAIRFEGPEAQDCDGEMNLHIVWPHYRQEDLGLEVFVRAVPLRVDSRGCVAEILSAELNAVGSGGYNNATWRGIFCDLVG